MGKYVTCSICNKTTKNNYECDCQFKQTKTRVEKLSGSFILDSFLSDTNEETNLIQKLQRGDEIYYLSINLFDYYKDVSCINNVMEITEDEYIKLKNPVKENISESVYCAICGLDSQKCLECQCYHKKSIKFVKENMVEVSILGAILVSNNNESDVILKLKSGYSSNKIFHVAINIETANNANDWQKIRKINEKKYNKMSKNKIKNKTIDGMNGAFISSAFVAHCIDYSIMFKLSSDNSVFHMAIGFESGNTTKIYKLDEDSYSNMKDYEC